MPAVSAAVPALGGATTVSDRSSSGTEQLSFASKEDKINDVLALASRHEFDRVFGLASGGKDSLTAIDAYHRLHEDHHLPAIDAVVHTNTGTTFPATQETVHEFCRGRGLPFIEVRNQTDGRMLAHRVLEHGWPAESQGGPGSGGHWPEFVNRKLDTWDGLYSAYPGELLFISGGRHDESDRRAANLGDGAVDVGETGDRKPRLTWVAPAHGLLDDEKEAYVDEYDIPVTPAYDWFGFSGDCLACSFDDPQILNEIRLACPELARALETLIVWVYIRIKNGDIDQPIERSVWGTPINSDPTGDDDPYQRDLSFGGCASCSKSCYTDGGDRSLQPETNKGGQSDE